MTEIRPQLASAFRAATGMTGTTFDTWNAGVPMPGYDASRFSGYRVVSYGVKFYSVTSPTASSGFAGVITTNGNSFQDMDVASSLYIDHARAPLYTLIGTWIAKPEGMARTTFVDITDPALGWSEVAIYVGGTEIVGARQNLVLEIIINAELHPQEGDVFAQTVSLASPDVPAVNHITANVVPKIPDTFSSKNQDSTPAIWKYAMEAVEAFARIAGPLAVEGIIALI
jgi:hypothetical protein